MISTAVGRVEQRKKKVASTWGIWRALGETSTNAVPPSPPSPWWHVWSARPRARERASDRLLTGIEHRAIRQ